MEMATNTRLKAPIVEIMEIKLMVETTEVVDTREMVETMVMQEATEMVTTMKMAEATQMLETVNLAEIIKMDQAHRTATKNQLNQVMLIVLSFRVKILNLSYIFFIFLGSPSHQHNVGISSSHAVDIEVSLQSGGHNHGKLLNSLGFLIFEKNYR